MNVAIFQRQNSVERQATIKDLIAAAKGTAIVISTVAGALAHSEQPRVRAGKAVVKLLIDPAAESDTFNPVDVLRRVTWGLEEAIGSLLHPLQPVSARVPMRPKYAVEPVWQALATELMHAVVAYHLRKHQFAASLVEALNHFLADDIVYKLAVILDTEGKLIEPNVYATIATFLQKKDDDRSSILSYIHASMSSFNTATAQRSLERTTFDLDMVLNGGSTVYMELPPQLWGSHGSVVRLWLAAFLQLAASAPVKGAPILFIVDHAAGLDVFPQLQASQRLASGTVEVCSFWESPGQISVRYPADWSAFIGNCRIIRAIGPQNPVVAAELAAAFNAPAAGLQTLGVGRSFDLWGESADSISVEDSGQRPSHARGGHIATFAPAYAERWSHVADLISGREGPVVVIESDGRCHELTAASRSKLGPVIRLDPFGVLGAPGDAFNPMDAIEKQSPNSGDQIMQFAERVMSAGVPSIDAFWNNSSHSLLAAVIQYINCVPEKTMSLGELWKIFHDDDVVYKLAVVLDTIGKRIPPEAYKQIAAFLQLDDGTRSRVLAHVCKSMVAYGIKSVQDSLERTTFDLDLFFSGRPTVFIELPPQLWGSHGSLARLWFSAFLQLAGHRANPAMPVLFVVDNASGLEVFPQLQVAQRMPEGLAEVWSFWESLDQLRLRYPADWSAFMGSCRAARALGPQNPATASDLARHFEVATTDLTHLRAGHSLTLWGDLDLPLSAPAVVAPAQPPRVGNVIRFAPMWAEKWEEVAQWMANDECSTIVIESSGRCHRLTEAARSTLGPVIRLDPFGVLNGTCDAFNPMDSIVMRGNIGAAESFRFVDVMVPDDPATIDPFWRVNTVLSISAIINHLAAAEKEKCNPVEVWNLFIAQNPKTDLAKLIAAKNPELPAWCRQVIEALLEKKDIEFGCLMAVAHQSLRMFGEPNVAACVEKTSFSIDEFATRTMTFYLELPIARSVSHRALLDLWLSALLSLRTASRPIKIVCDSPFSAELFPALRDAQRTPATQVWTFWETFDQLKLRCPTEWSAFVANAGQL